MNDPSIYRRPLPTRPVGHTVSERGPIRQPWGEHGCYRRPGLILSRSCDACNGTGMKSSDTALAVLQGCAECDDYGTVVRFRGASRVVHNLLAHPLLILCPPLGEWLHERTEP